MRRKQNTAWLLVGIWLPAAIGCGTVVEDPDVDFGDARPLGSWHPPTAQKTFETEGLEPEPNVATASAAGAPAVAPPPATTLPNGTNVGQGQKPPSTAAGAPALGSAGAAAPSGKPAQPQTGAAGAAAPGGSPEPEPAVEPESPPPAEASGVSMLELNYSTESLGGRYSPKNIGAIWVTDSSGKLVKSLEVWARTRLRYLTTYAAARASARPDVTATATLTNHKAHTARWDLKDTAGAAVPPGKYTLHAEVTDSHADGRSIAVPFDTSAGATMIEQPDSPGFIGMKLVLK